VVLPPDFDKQPNQKYALHVHVGGFGTRYTSAQRMRPDPRLVQVVLDGAGPFGDPYQVDSANNGPYGAALTEEVIPLIEKQFRCLGTSRSRFTSGGSTGGWVSFALQVFYPDFFNGCWSQCPDGVDFRAFELIDIYADANAYVNKFGFERPSKRTIDGDTIFTVRHESRIERVLGRGGRWELGGRDWASWNAAYGPRGADGRPKPLWDGETGAIDKSVVEHWKKYDLRRVLEATWPARHKELAGKIHVWVGDADDYFLNNGVHRFKAAADRLTPAFDGRLLIEMRRTHTGGGWTDREMLDAMAARAK
jgi:Putative esterase